MRLKHIKLAGFKSFVDPTKVLFEQQMTAIVGPNGCGKSNIIDAVRWVLGESNAKHLRGDAMTDVIFNGAASRKPIGQASVELVFENTSGRVVNGFADRSEISIRRLVNRESQTTYFLNGSKCRRKDITDIFLGTGLGPRSYAIIEQGTISKLIESKPQELRVFIEEAAGISKYKERRRETEVRIRHTRENLARLDDLRAEINNQIDSLHQQAEAAKRYTELKAQERKLKSELAAFRWQKFTQQCTDLTNKVKSFEQQIIDHEVAKKERGIAIFSHKASLTDNNKALNDLLQQKAECSNNAVRLEQQLKFDTEQHSRLVKEKATIEKHLSSAQTTLASNTEIHQSHSALESKLQPEFAASDTAFKEAEIDYQAKVKQQKDVQQTFIEYQQAKNKHETRISQLNNMKSSASSKLNVLTSQLEQIANKLTNLPSSKVDDINNNDLSISEFKKQQSVLLASQNQDEKSLAVYADKLEQFSKKQESLLAEQTVKIHQLEKVTIRLEQQDNWQIKQSEFLTKQNISEFGSAIQSLQVEEKWRNAVFMVLAEFVNSQLVDQLPENISLDDINLVIKPCGDQVPLEASSGSLSEQVKNGQWAYQILNHVFYVDTITQAQRLLPKLSITQSIITPCGTWLSHHFLRKGEQNQANLAITQALAEQQELTNDLAKLKVKIATNTNDVNITKEQLQAITNQVQSQAKKVAELEQSLQGLLQENQVLLSQQQMVTDQQKEFEAQQSNIKSQLTQTKQEVEQASTQLHLLAQQNLTATQADDLLKEQERCQLAVENASLILQNKQKAQHELSLALEKAKHKTSQSHSELVVSQRTIKQLHEQLQRIQEQSLLDNKPASDVNVKLQKALQAVASVNQEIVVLEEQSALLDEALKTLEQTQESKQQRIDFVKDKLNRSNLDFETAKLRAEGQQEQLAELGLSGYHVSQKLPDNFKESQWQGQLIKLSKDISMLGAINLAAIDQFEKELSRKNYLDQQNQDLNLALTRLESAILKIDKESRIKFKATFEQVNADLQRLFPKVFGGGSAYLALTGEDLLETGVTIMARPPGKKNSTIHLLSGGEKALTALSLVFSIFRLNPAPFCMLDEVDAPLDDANVERFCKLVQEMSNTVQFIYISHNKIAMEMATHLTGVTMFEPGVSRMVAVDIDEAIAMAEVS